MKTKFRRNTVSFLNTKPYHSLFSCFIFLAFLTTAFAQETPPQDVAEDDLDLKALFAAIKHHNALLKSGEGEVVYTLGVPPFDTIDTDVVTGNIAFDSENARFDSRSITTILTPTTMWQIDKNRFHLNYHSTKPRLLPKVDPRHWLTLSHKDLATYLRVNNFYITGREVFNDTLCYVLEAKQGDSSKKIWIAPERGFRYLKHESQQPTPVDALDSDIPMEALTIFRTTISYQQFGEIWFPKTVHTEYSWLDFKATEPIISRQTLEIKNFKVNHNIPPETFTVDIPDDAVIKVEGIEQELSKQEFLKRYGQQTDN